VKKTTTAILILSVLLAMAVGWIVLSTIRGDQALKDAKVQIEEAEARAKAADEKAVKAEAETETLRVSSEKKDAENTKQAGIIISQARTIDALKAEKKAQQEIADAAVEHGADLKTYYKAGEPIVRAVNIQALMDWYNGMGLKIEPVLLSIDAFQASIGLLGLRIIELETQNAGLTASNGTMQDLIDADKVTITGHIETIDGLRVEIAGVRADLEDAGKDIQTAMNRVNLGEGLAWAFGILSGLEAGYIAGHLLGAW
jgi:hypothetical protein